LNERFAFIQDLALGRIVRELGNTTKNAASVLSKTYRAIPSLSAFLTIPANQPSKPEKSKGAARGYR